jgi:hydrogenase-4 component E
LAPGRSAEFALAAGILCAKAVLVAPVLAAGVSRTRQSRPVRDETSPLLRLAATVALVLAAVGLMPAFGLEPAAAEDGATAMVAIGLVMLVLRRAALFQVLALLVAENGIALAAVSVSGGLPVVVELGVAFDLVVLVLVAAVFHERIFRSFGTTDTAALGDLNE